MIIFMGIDTEVRSAIYIMLSARFFSRDAFSFSVCFFFFFFNDTATTEIYTLSLHDALPICALISSVRLPAQRYHHRSGNGKGTPRSEEHTSELQSRGHLVCRLLLEKKK